VVHDAVQHELDQMRDAGQIRALAPAQARYREALAALQAGHQAEGQRLLAAAAEFDPSYPDPHFTLAGAFFSQQVHATRGPSTTMTIDDFVGPDRPPEAKAAGLPYIKGGICETGGGIGYFQEIALYAGAYPTGGSRFKELMRQSVLRRHAAGRY